VRTVIIDDNPRTQEKYRLAFQIGWPSSEVKIYKHRDNSKLSIVEKEHPDLIIINYCQNKNISCCCEFIKQLRLFSSVPIIIVADEAEELEIIEALESGADEFLNEPVGQMELLARIRAIIRRQKPPRVELPYTCSGLCLYPSSGNLNFKGKTIDLSRSESLILLQLMKNIDKSVSYSSLSETLWGAEYPGSLEAIRVYVNRLKHKIKDRIDGVDLIQNIPNIGYRLITP